MRISIGNLVEPERAAIQILENLAGRYGTTLADCDDYSLRPIEKVTAAQRAEDERMTNADVLPWQVKPNPYR